MENLEEKKNNRTQNVYVLDTCTLSAMAERADGWDPTDAFPSWSVAKKRDYVRSIDSLLAHFKSGDVKFVIPKTVVEELSACCRDGEKRDMIQTFMAENFSQKDVFPSDEKTETLIKFYASSVLQNSEAGNTVHYKNGDTEYLHYEIFDWLKGAHTYDPNPLNWVSNDAIIMATAQVYQVLTGQQTSLITDNTSDFIYGPVTIGGKEEKVNKQHVLREVNYSNQEGLCTVVHKFGKDLLDGYYASENVSEGEHQARLAGLTGVTPLTPVQANAVIESGGKVLDTEASRAGEPVFLDDLSPNA